nr:MAG TPA: hypothetical protein [Caudoviricetes sp.]
MLTKRLPIACLFCGVSVATRPCERYLKSENVQKMNNLKMFGFLRSVKCDIIFKIFVTLRLVVFFEKRHTKNLKSY